MKHEMCLKSLSCVARYRRKKSFGDLLVRLNSLWRIFVTRVSESQLAAAGERKYSKQIINTFSGDYRAGVCLIKYAIKSLGGGTRDSRDRYAAIVVPPSSSSSSSLVATTKLRARISCQRVVSLMSHVAKWAPCTNTLPRTCVVVVLHRLISWQRHVVYAKKNNFCSFSFTRVLFSSRKIHEGMYNWKILHEEMEKNFMSQKTAIRKYRREIVHLPWLYALYSART